MPGYVNVAGVWKESSPYVKVGGSWKFSPEAWENVSGEWKQWFLANGFNDSSFATYNVSSNANNNVNEIIIQSDGKIILAGTFTVFNGVTVNRIARLNANGSLDTAFAANTGTGGDDLATAIAVQSDGKIILGGNFTTFNGVTVNRIVRLNSDGTPDTAFTTNTGTGASGIVTHIAVQSDGKIILGGNFTTFNGVTVNRIVRLNSDGTPDTAFTTNTGTGAANTVTTMAIQSDGKIILGGLFATFNGVTVGGIVRLNLDGTRETAFTTNTGSGGAGTNSIAIQSDGKIVLVGSFQLFNGAFVNRIVRLNSDGTRDTAFSTNTGTGATGGVNTVAIQSDGKIVFGGDFTGFNGTTVNRIVRLNSDGTPDTTFTTNTGTGASSGVNFLAIQSDGKIVLGGQFGSFNSVSVSNAVRLNSDGTIQDLIVSGAGSGIAALAIQSDGKIVLVGNFTTFNGVTANYVVRLNSDGARDTVFSTNTGTGANGQVSAVAIQSDGKILIGGQFSFSTFNGVTVNRIVRLNSDGTPDTTFTTNTGTGAAGSISSIAVQSDGKIILSGGFTTFNGATVGNLVRLNSDGTREAAFTTNTGTGASGGTISTTAVQSDGKIILGGNFTTFNGTTVNRIVRLNSDGTPDTTFTTNTGTGAATGAVSALAIQSDGKIILGGTFTDFNGVTVNRIIRLNTDGTRDTTFTTNTGTGANGAVSALAIQSDGKIVLGGAFTTFNDATVGRIVCLNLDGTRDTTFTTNTGTGANGALTALGTQSDGKIVLGGEFSFTSFNNVTRTRVARIGGNLTF